MSLLLHAKEYIYTYIYILSKKQKSFYLVFNEQQQKDCKSIQTSRLIITLMHFEL